MNPLQKMLWYLGNIWDYGLQMLPSALAAAAVFFCLRPWRRRRLAALGLTSGPWVFFYAFGQPEYVRSTGVFSRPAMGRARLEEGSADRRVQFPFCGDHTALSGAEQRYQRPYPESFGRTVRLLGFPASAAIGPRFTARFRCQNRRIPEWMQNLRSNGCVQC